MTQPPQVPQPPRVPQVPQVPRLPQPPKLPGGFKFGRKKKGEAAAAQQAPQDPQAAAAPPAEPGQPGAPAQYETWKWPTVDAGEPEPTYKKFLIAFVVIVLLALGAFAAYYFLVREDKAKEPAAAPAKQAAATTPAKPAKKPQPGVTLKSWAAQMESVLASSSANRVKLVSVLGGVQNNCATKPAAAIGDVNAVAAGRQQLLARLTKLKPPTAAAARAQGLLRQSLTASLAANRAYSAWLNEIKSASPCPGSTSNPNLVAAGKASEQATSAKQAFVGAFNPIASKVGLETWSADKI